MAQRVRDILLRIRGDASDAEQDLHQLARELQRFDGITAEATVDVNTTAANRKMDAAKKSVQDYGRMAEQAKVDLQTTAAQTKLNQLRQNLENLQKRPVTPKIEIAIGRTVAQIERVEAQLDKLDRRRVDIDVDVGRGIGGILGTGTRAIGAGIGTVAEGVSGVVAAASRGIPILGQLGATFATVAASGGVLGIAMAGLAVIMGVALLHAVVMLTGALVAVGASLLAAAAAVGVLATAFAAAFGPVVLVAIAAMARFAKVLEAVKQAEDGAAEGAQRVRDASEASAQAQRNAVDASARVRTTAVDAYRAWRDAAEETSDAIRGITDAELSRERAQLSLKQAKQDLADFRKETGLTGDSLDGMFKKFTDVDFRPKDLVGAIRKSAVGSAAEREGVDPLDLADKILRVKEAQQGVVNAEENVSDAVTRANDAREREQEFIQNGIRAYAPYTAAVAANAAAQKAVAEAAEDTAEARDKQTEALKDLTPQERRLVDVLIDLKETLTDVFRPATRAVFAGLLDLLEDLADFAKDTGVRRGLRQIGEAIGDVLRSFGRLLRRREVRDAFADLATAGAGVVRQLGRVFRSVFTILLRIAQAALPWLKEVSESIGDFFVGLARSARRSRVQKIVDDLKDTFKVWWGLAREVWGVIRALFGSAQAQGTRFIRDVITPIVRNFRRKLEADPEAINNFFKDATDFARDLLTVVSAIVEALAWIINAAGDVKDAFEKIPSPVRKGALEGAKRGLPFPFNVLFGQTGGPVPGTGLGDRVPAMLEPGEYVLRRSVASAIGVGRLNLLNAGNIAALSGGRGGVHIENINLPPAPGHGQLGDPRHQAVQLARELRRRGEHGIGGGGIP